MKRRYTKKQIKTIISKLEGKLVTESLSPSTEEKLKAAAKKFAKWFGEQIKSGQAQRFEDGNYDALVAIKETIKMNSSAKNMIKFLKSEQNTVVPGYAIEAVAEAGSKAFIANVFDGSKALVDELNRAIDFLEKTGFEATEDYIEALANAIQDEKDKKLQNLKKSTEQFNYFANCVFGIWRRDPEISQTLGRIPQLPTTAKDLDDLKDEFNEPEEDDAGEDDDIEQYLHDSEGEIEEEDDEIDEEEDDEKPKEKVTEAEDSEYSVSSLIKVLQRNCNPNDKVMCRLNPGKKECFIYDVYSKGGYAIIDIVQGRVADPRYL